MRTVFINRFVGIGMLILRFLSYVSYVDCRKMAAYSGKRRGDRLGMESENPGRVPSDTLRVKGRTYIKVVSQFVQFQGLTPIHIH